jgi:hypothetical protein
MEISGGNAERAACGYAPDGYLAIQGAIGSHVENRKSKQKIFLRRRDDADLRVVDHLAYLNCGRIR